MHGLLHLAQDNAIHIDPNGVVNALVYTLLGVLVFGAAFFVMTKIVPFSMRKEIEEDQNTSLGIIVGSVIIGLAIVIGAAVHGGSTTIVVQGTEAGVAPANTETPN